MKEEYRGFTYEIQQDEDAESPREWDNLGVMCCEHRRYNLGDGGMEQLYDALCNDMRWSDLYLNLPDDEHTPFEADDYPAMIEQAEKWGYIVMPLYLYDHSGITMSTSPFADPWDSGQVGIIFCTPQRRKEGGHEITELEARNYLKHEVEVYDSYLRGDVHCYSVYDCDDDLVDSCCGFYGYEGAEKEAKEAIDYLIHLEGEQLELLSN